MKIAVYEVEEWEKEAFEVLRTGGHDVVTLSEPLTPENAAEHSDAGIISPFIYSHLGRDTLRHFGGLRMIATRSTGFDHIDMDYCRERGVVVSNVPNYGENTVAEHVFALILAISHRMYDAIDRTRKGDFSQAGLRGFDLRGKTIGVIGVGGIGRHVIEIARGFNMRVLAYDVRRNERLSTELGFAYEELPEILSQSDIITLHVPANEKTKDFISTDEFNLMKNGVVIINTSRGSVLNVQALLRAIADGKVGAAGLDVLDEEPAIREEAELLSSIFRKKYDLETVLANSVLLRLRNVLITPHSAFNTKEAVQRILKTSVENIAAFLAGQPENIVGQAPGKAA